MSIKALYLMWHGWFQSIDGAVWRYPWVLQAPPPACATQLSVRSVGQTDAVLYCPQAPVPIGQPDKE